MGKRAAGVAKARAGGGGGDELRKDALEVVRLDRAGCYDKAIALVEDLAHRYPRSGMALHLAGRIHLYSARRGVEQSEDVEGHLVSARGYLAEAKWLVPGCIDISILFAEALMMSSLYYEAGEEIDRAIQMEFPVDPMENNIMYFAGGKIGDTSDERVEYSKGAALRFSEEFGHSVIAHHVPHVIREALELDTDVREGAVKALKIADDLAKRYDFSSRAQCFRAYMRLKYARSIEAGIDKRPFLVGIITNMNLAVLDFPRSLTLGLIRAKVCFVLGKYTIMQDQCHVGTFMKNPHDPNLDDIPPGSAIGETYEDRVYNIRHELDLLMKNVLRMAEDYWNSFTREKQDRFLTLRLVDVRKYFDDTYGLTNTATRCIDDAVFFFKKHGLWTFCICPYCPGRKLVDTDALLRHICNKHPVQNVVWKLQLFSVAKQGGDISEDDCIMDDISVCQDSDDNYVFRFKLRDDMFKHLFYTDRMEIDGKTFDQIRDDKTNRGFMILQKIKRKLTDLPADKLRFDHARPEVEGLWYDFLQTSTLDYRVVMLPHAREFLWYKLRKCMQEESFACTRRITNADIDNIFPNVVYLSNVLNSGFHFEDENSGVMVNDKSSDQPTDIVEDGKKLIGTLGNVRTDLKCDSSTKISLPSSIEDLHNPAEETPSISRFKRTVHALQQYNADEDLFFLNVIVQSLWSLKCFHREILRRPPACFHLIHMGPCITGILYEIFALEKTGHFRMARLLTYMKTTLCEVVHDSEMFHKMQVGRNFASEIMAMIVEGLHHSETCLNFVSNDMSKRVVTDHSCINFICRAHDLFGIKLKQLMSCSCGEWFGEDYTSIFHVVDASSLDATKTKPLAELLVLMDERLNHEKKCNKCSGSVRPIDCFLSHGRHFFTIVLKNWKVCHISKATMPEVFFGIASPFDITLLYRGVTLTRDCVRPSAKYNLVSAICYVDQHYVLFVHDMNRWHIYDIDTVKVVDSWEELLEHYRETSLQPEILFLEVMK